MHSIESMRIFKPSINQSTPKGSRFLALSKQLFCLTLFSRILGLCRDVAIAWIVGSGLYGDLLAQVLRIPHSVRRLLSEGSLSLHLTTCFIAENNAPQLFWSVHKRVCALVLCCTLLCVGAAPWIASALSVEQGGDILRTSLLRLALPYCFFAGMAAVCMSYLHACGEIVRSLFSPILFNLVLLSCIAIAACSPDAALWLVCGGFSLAGLVQWLYQEWLIRKRPSFGSSSPPTTSPSHILAEQPLSLLAASSYHGIVFVGMIALSAWGEGQVAALFYAERLLELPLGLLGISLGMAQLPALARFFSQKKYGRFRRQLSVALHWMLLLLIPCGAGLYAIGDPLVELLFGHGNFTLEGLARTWYVVQTLILALPACALGRLFVGAVLASLGLSVAATMTLVSVLVAALLCALGLFPTIACVLALWLHAAGLWGYLRYHGLCAWRWSLRVWLAHGLGGCAAFAVARACCLAKDLVGTSLALFCAVFLAVFVWIVLLQLTAPRDVKRLLARFF